MLDDVEVLRAFVEQLRRVIDVRPNLRCHVGEMERGNISEVLKILEEALKPVCRIDKQERKKRKRKTKGQNGESDKGKDEDEENGADSPRGMSSGSEDADE